MIEPDLETTVIISFKKKCNAERYKKDFPDGNSRTAELLIKSDVEGRANRKEDVVGYLQSQGYKISWVDVQSRSLK